MYCASALLKLVEDGKTNFVFFTDAITRVNKALASRCLKHFNNRPPITKDTIFEGLDPKEKDIVLSVLGKADIKRYDIFKQRLDYSKIFNYLSKAYSNKDLWDDIEIDRWNRELKKLYPDRAFRKRIAQGCYIKGVLFDARKVKDSLWSYDEVQPKLKSCLTKLLHVAAACFDVLRNRCPLRKKR